MKSKIKFATRFIYCCGFQFQVLCQNFWNATNSKDRPTVDAKNSAKCGANLLVEHWKHWTPITKVTMPSLWHFAGPQGEFNKFHSLLGSVSVHVQDKTFTVLPLPSIIFSGICKNLADTWPATSRKYPGNEVGANHAVCSLAFFYVTANLTATDVWGLFNLLDFATEGSDQ